jgi:hypothetical protein
VALEDVVPELALVLEVVRPQRAPPSLAVLVVALELVLLAELPPLAVVLAVLEVAAVVLVLLPDEDAVAAGAVEGELAQVDEAETVEFAVPRPAAVLVESAAVDAPALPHLVGLLDLGLVLLPQLLDRRQQRRVQRRQPAQVQQLLALPAARKHTSHNATLIMLRIEHVSSLKPVGQSAGV